MIGHQVRIAHPLLGIAQNAMLRVGGVRNNGELALEFGRGHLLVDARAIRFVSKHSAAVAYTRTYRAAERVRDWLEAYGVPRTRTAWYFSRSLFVVTCHDDDAMKVAAIAKGFQFGPETGVVLVSARSRRRRRRAGRLNRRF